jgi:hypothetical protein
VEVIVRDYNPKTDDAYIHSTWSKQDWYALPDEYVISKKDFFSKKREEIKSILAHAPYRGIKIYVASIKGDPGTLLGYTVFQGENQLRICIKKSYLNIGIELLLSLAHKDNHASKKIDPSVSSKSPLSASDNFESGNSGVES